MTKKTLSQKHKLIFGCTECYQKTSMYHLKALDKFFKIFLDTKKKTLHYLDSAITLPNEHQMLANLKIFVKKIRKNFVATLKPCALPIKNNIGLLKLIGT